MIDIDWETERSYAFINPHLPEQDRKNFEGIKYKLEGHIFLTTSGTQSLKSLALSKTAFLASAKAVNDHLDASLHDSWVNPLPYFHVGGLSIYARAYLSGSTVYRYDYKWDPVRFIDYVNEIKGTLTSLVPTQLWDLIEAGISPPPSLRALIIGGQRLSNELYEKGKALGWPLMPTYGMTETCSQIATASLGSPELKLLPHIEARLDESGRLCLKSPALFTGYFNPHFIDPKIEGWFHSEDFAKLDLTNCLIIPQGRGADMIKIKGELINLFDLEAKLETLKHQLNIHAETTLIPKPDPRTGFSLHLYHTPCHITPLITAFNESVIPEARLFASTSLDALPKTPLGKFAKNKLG